MRAALVIFFAALCIGGSFANEAYRKDICGRIIHREHNGFILSHKRFERFSYPKNYNCLWRIQAPPLHRIRLFAPSFSVEFEKNCNFDHLDIFDDVNERNIKKRIGKLCGSNREHYYISSGAYMTLRWWSDRVVRKMGFLLRYEFIPANSVAAGAQRVERKKCSAKEFKCRTDGLCIPRKFLCDKINDCNDHSDEKRCPGIPSNSKCTNDEYQCRSIKKCITNLFKCDGFKDCRPLNDDESQCSPATRPPATAQPITTTTPTKPLTTRPATTKPSITTATTNLVTTKPQPTPSFSCGSPKILPDEDESRVVGGKIAVSGSWPWTVSLRYNGGHTCGGSILAPRWVLTAAHCVEGYTTVNAYSIVAGLHRESNTGSGTQTIGVQRIVIHPNWNSQATDYDYTLLYLKKPLTYTNRIGPICLPSKTLGGAVGCFVAGWGDTKGTGGAGYLKQAFVKTFTHGECNGFYGGVTNRMICAGHREGGRDTCQGDSGGPLMCKINGKWELHGATSFGGVCAAPNSPGVYARISTVASWIKSRTGV